MEDIKKCTQIAIARAVVQVAENLQNYDDDTVFQYVLAEAYASHDSMFMYVFDSINKRHMTLGYMTDELIKERAYWGKLLTKHIKAVAPYGYEELKEYAVMFSID